MSSASDLQYREGAQRAEDAADAEGVGDRLAQAVAGRDREVGAGGLVHADLDDVDDEVGVREGRAAVEVRGDLRFGAAYLGDVPGRALRRREPFRVDVVQRDPGVGEFGEGEQVGEQALREHHTAGADEGDPSRAPSVIKFLSGSGQLGCAAHPLSPLDVSDWMNVFCASRNATSTGTTVMTLPAITADHLVWCCP
jgi:hypothetical protein